MRVVTCDRFWCHLCVGISEIDITHIISIMQKIWIQSIIEPRVMGIIITFQMAFNHHEGASEQPQANVRPKDWSNHIEPRVRWAHQFVVWVLREFLVSQKILEGMVELVNTMHGQEVRTKSKNTHAWYGISTPVSVKVSFYVIVENTVSTSDRVSLNTLSEITWLFWDSLQLIWRRSRVTFIEAQKGI